jgi:hypothetical protein
MIRGIGIVLLTCLCTVVVPTYAADSVAPFGLEWAMHVKAAEALGIKLQPAKSEDGTSFFTAEGLPKILGDVEAVRLDFGYADKLRKVVAVSRSFGNDPYGGAVMARYNELFQLLESKYGRGKTTYRMGDSIYAEQRFFLAGIQAGRSWHYANFEADGISVELSIRAKDGDTGFWVLIYENKAMAKDFEKEKRERDKKSL